MPMFGGLGEAFAPATMIAGAVLAIVAIVVAAVALRSMFAAGDAMDSTVRLFARKPRPVDHWLCGRCRSYNRVDQSRCYRGCGSREEVEERVAAVPGTETAGLEPAAMDRGLPGGDAGEPPGTEHRKLLAAGLGSPPVTEHGNLPGAEDGEGATAGDA